MELSVGCVTVFACFTYLLACLLTYLQVRKAHRNLAMLHHPDKVGDP